MTNKKIKIPGEIVFLIANILLALSVSMISASNFGVSMIVAPAYILSQKLTFLTFGQSEYIIQAILIIVFCIVMKKVKLVYFSSFVTCLIYGFILDMWRSVVPLFNPNVTAPGSMAMPVRITLFVVGMVMTSFSVALFFHTYLYPQVYDFFVKGVSKRYDIKLSKFKTCFDFSCLAVACIMTLVLFRKFVGVGIGTLIMTALNGTIIGFFNKIIEKYIDTTPLAPNFAKKFEL
ncbi:MAG: DUF6198 family protein [Clostridia bacterium]|nr:DUF6198 family protein [Clostridia bacterium]